MCRKDCSDLCCKGLFHSSNFVVWIIGLIIGAYIAFVFAMRDDIPGVNAIDDEEGWERVGLFFAAEVFISVLLACAVLIVLLGICGCCGVGAESFCLIKTYILFMMLIVLAEITAMIYMVVAKGNVSSMLSTIWWQLDKWSRGVVHHWFHCCGFQDQFNYTVSAEANFNDCMTAAPPPTLPDCLDEFKEWGVANVHVWVAIFCAIIFCQGVAIFSSCVVYSSAFQKMRRVARSGGGKDKTLKKQKSSVQKYSPSKSDSTSGGGSGTGTGSSSDSKRTKDSRGKRKVGPSGHGDKRRKDGKGSSTVSTSSETRESFVRPHASKEQNGIAGRSSKRTLEPVKESEREKETEKKTKK